MQRITLISIMLLALTTACATSTEEQPPEPAPVAATTPPPAPEPEPVPAALDDTVAEETTVAMLPDTASHTPALAAGGLSAIVLAGLVGVIRRRLF